MVNEIAQLTAAECWQYWWYHNNHTSNVRYIVCRQRERKKTLVTDWRQPY